MNLSKMSKEELELLSYTKIAELYLKDTKKTMTTAELFREVCNLLELGEAEYQQLIADFFQSLTTSKEFLLLDDGKWDLRENHIVKIQVDDDEDEKDEDGIDEDIINDEDENSDEDFDNLDSTYSDSEDLSDLTIVGEDELEEE